MPNNFLFFIRFLQGNESWEICAETGKYVDENSKHSCSEMMHFCDRLACRYRTVFWRRSLVPIHGSMSSL